MRNYKNIPIPPAIQKAADEYIGYPHEVDEGVAVSMRRVAELRDKNLVFVHHKALDPLTNTRAEFLTTNTAEQ